MQSIANKLLKFSKNELVDIIINRSLPDSVSDCESLQYIKGNKCEKCVKDPEEVFHDSVESPGCTLPECKQLKRECVFLTQQLSTKDRLITHLEGRINDQAILIDLYKTSTKSQIITTAPSQRQRETHQTTAEQMTPSSGPSNKSTGTAETFPNSTNLSNYNRLPTRGNDKVSFEQQQSQAFPIVKDLPSDGFTEVVGRRKRNLLRTNKPITGLKADTSELVASRSLAFLHVYKLDPKYTEEDLTRYLKQSFPEVTCEKLNSRYPNYYSSFKVIINEEYLTTAMSPEFWPKGVCVNRFFHKRRIPQKLG